MDTQLLTLSKIFTERIFRIPDFQRGYAWTDKQLRDFWADICQLETSQNHYTGVLTLETVPAHIQKRWDEDLWIIESKRYDPYYVVDGQQRLTTALILIQTILETMSTSSKLNFTEKGEIQRKFLFDTKDNGISRSYIFGYEKDNPSYEFLKTKIFCEQSSSHELHETVYTQNLANAKRFFAEAMEQLNASEIESLYRKVTQQLLFNLFIISEEVDVCVAFETMNNRGKPLSYLELLKNRLIYLSLKFNTDEHERRKLRETINNCWKTIYHNLGRNQISPLDDDLFLSTHYLMYFSSGALTGMLQTSEHANLRNIFRPDYATELLEARFIIRNILPNADPDDQITLEDIYKYVQSLQESVVTWYKIWTPFETDYSIEVQTWLDKLNRIQIGTTRALVLAFLLKVPDDDIRVQFLSSFERLHFITRLVDYHFVVHYVPLCLGLAQQLWVGSIGAKEVISMLDAKSKELIEDKGVTDLIINTFNRAGFYHWSILKYFLFEYDLNLKQKSKTNRQKLHWTEFAEAKEDWTSVEHIYPRSPKDDYWRQQFRGYSERRRTKFLNSLGNLLPLSRPKNSSLSNRPFTEKVSTADKSVGYKYGCYAENEVTEFSKWGPDEIVRRGLRLLEFMEARWSIKLGTEQDKLKMLGLEFFKG